MFSSSKCSSFHNSKIFGSCIIHILYTECAKIKKKNISGTKRLRRSDRRIAYMSMKTRRTGLDAIHKKFQLAYQLQINVEVNGINKDVETRLQKQVYRSTKPTCHFLRILCGAHYILEVDTLQHRHATTRTLTYHILKRSSYKPISNMPKASKTFD